MALLLCLSNGSRGFFVSSPADAESLRRAIEEQPVEFRGVLLLSDMEEMSYQEIAETLSIPIGTVTSRLMRARQKVRKAFSREQ